MLKKTDIISWLDSLRDRPQVKVLSGLRGVGKNAILARWRDHLLASGVPEDRVVCVDAEEPVLRHLDNHETIMAFLRTQLPDEGHNYLIINEPTSFVDYRKVLESLLTLRDFDTYVSVSTHQLLDEWKDTNLPNSIAHAEILPDFRKNQASPEAVRARWNEIFLKDVLSNGRLMDARLAERVAGCIADHMGEQISLRTISAEVSQPGQFLSPNTISSYINALVNSHLIEKTYRWDDFAGEKIRNGYRIFYTDPTLRIEHFGPTPVDEERRASLNRAWLELRHLSLEVYLPKVRDPEVDFLARIKGEFQKYKAVNGNPVRVK